MIHSIFPVQFMCLTVFLHNLSPSPFWSTSWSWRLEPSTSYSYISSPNHCLLFTTRAYHNLFCRSSEIIYSTPGLSLCTQLLCSLSLISKDISILVSFCCKTEPNMNTAVVWQVWLYYYRLYWLCQCSSLGSLVYLNYTCSCCIDTPQHTRPTCHIWCILVVCWLVVHSVIITSVANNIKHAFTCMCMHSDKIYMLLVQPSLFMYLFISCIHLSFTHTHTRARFMALWILSGTTWVSQYQKKHSPTHTYPDHQSSFICFLHLLQFMASFLFNLRAWQSFCATSVQVFFGLCIGNWSLVI